jgi:HTH-type transcriptional regulator, sugar sensing transcriptional regulator
MPRAAATADAQAQQTLRQLGFTGYQAQVWLALTQGFPATAYELAKRCGLPRANVYAAMRRLLALGAVSQAGTRPMTYSPSDPQTFVERQALDLRDRCQALATQLGQRVQRQGRGALRVTVGAAECQAHVQSEIDAARQYLWLKGRAAVLLQFKGPLALALARGVQVKLIVFGSLPALQRALPQAQCFLHEGSGQRLSGATDALLTMARDGHAVTTVAFSGAPTLTFARDHLLVYVMHSYLLHEIFLAEMAHGRHGRHGAWVREQLLALRQQHRPPGMERTVALR